jgi:hypothetical protein
MTNPATRTIHPEAVYTKFLLTKGGHLQARLAYIPDLSVQGLLAGDGIRRGRMRSHDQGWSTIFDW